MSEYPELSANALRTLEARYLRRDARGRIFETPDDMFHRVANAVAEGELNFGGASELGQWREKFFRLLRSLEFLPNSPCLMNAGTPLNQLSACFVLPVEDSLEEIFDSVKHMALVQATGGGTGFSFSRLRPSGDRVTSTSGKASGPASFIKIFDAATQQIQQGGKRRGANMGVLRCDHPDVFDFVRLKRTSDLLSSFNISVGVTDAFMESVEDDGEWQLRHPSSGAVKQSVCAAELFEEIVESAWMSGDPGLLFLDAIARGNPLPELGEIEATNPCGEIPLLPFESCNLGSINLSKMLLYNREHRQARIDWDKLEQAVEVAVRFLDDMVEVGRFPLPQIDRITRSNRKIGLGVMGFADLLMALEVPYGSDKAAGLATQIMNTVRFKADKVSQRLAQERGSFPSWHRSRYATRGTQLRHATRTAIAPTGTLSLIADTTPSIEPLFALAYRRSNVLNGQSLMELNPRFEAHLRKRPNLVERVYEAALSAEEGDLRALLPPEMRPHYATALELPPEAHVAMAAAFQSETDNSVSKNHQPSEGCHQAGGR